MSKGLFGRVLLLDSGFPMLSSRIMAFNLIAKLSGNTVLTWVLIIDIPLQPIHKEMVRPKLSTRSL